MTITCKLTGKTGKGINAHIVPKAFYEIPPQNEGPFRLVSNKKGTFPKKLPVGIYDDQIVTIEGEQNFSVWDDYAAKILIQDFDDFEEVERNERIITWKLSKYDYTLLKLFALSILWRANVSKHPVFSKVAIGPHESEIHKMLLSNDPRGAEYYSVNISRWISHDFGAFLMDPIPVRYSGINYYRIYCGRYIFEIKVDRRKTTIDKFKKYQLREGESLCLIPHDLQKSKEWSLIQKIVKQNVS